jgi:hypothetical protein
MAQRFSNNVFFVGECTGWQKGLPFSIPGSFQVEGIT